MAIFVVTHKEYTFPVERCYVPIKVGKSTFNLTRGVSDDTQDNISAFNSSFCELTALYWIWKNTDDKFVGLMHYRRYFKGDGRGEFINGKPILSCEEIARLVSKYDLVVAEPRNYYIVSIRKHYIKAHYEADLQLLESILQEKYPQYMSSFKHVMNGRKLSLYNMFLAKKDVLDKYCEWLFPMLFILEKEIRYKDYDAYQKRVFGFLAERLFNVWIFYNQRGLKIKEMPIINIEGENVIKKGIGMLKRQFL